MKTLRLIVVETWVAEDAADVAQHRFLDRRQDSGGGRLYRNSWEVLCRHMFGGSNSDRLGGPGLG